MGNSVFGPHCARVAVFAQCEQSLTDLMAKAAIHTDGPQNTQDKFLPKIAVFLAIFF
jgi:hypothetical protein